jgi:hypothetical protein
MYFMESRYRARRPVDVSEEGRNEEDLLYLIFNKSGDHNENTTWLLTTESNKGLQEL